VATWRGAAAHSGVILLGAAVAAHAAAAQECRHARGERVAAIAGTYAVGEALMAAAHPSDWWQGPPRSFRFNWINGNGSPAAGQDFLLHVAASYQASQAAALAWRWACAPPLAAAVLGAATAFAVGLPKKVVDGFHDTGFEAAKVVTNALGSALPVAHAAWPATRAAALKVWYWPSRELRERAGSEPRLLSDYAGQRYYLSINPARGGLGPRWWPRWLGLALGHSTPAWVTEAPARHDWYAALDLELRGLPIRGGWWPRVAAALDQIHFPAPGVRLRGGTLSIGVF